MVVTGCSQLTDAATYSTLALRPGLFPDLTLYQNLLIQRSLNDDGYSVGCALKELEFLFERCGWTLDLRVFQSLYPNEASTEQLLMVCIGRALLSSPLNLVLYTSEWPEQSNLSIEQFEEAYRWCYPWRKLTILDLCSQQAARRS